MRVAMLLALAALTGCASTGTPAEIAPVPTDQPPAPAETILAPSAPRPNAPASEEPAPLQAGTDGGFAPSTGQRTTTTCAPDTIRRTLEEVVGQCRRGASALCGEIKVRASADGKRVQVTLDVTKDSFDDSFSKCVTSKLDAVAWRCTLPGSDTTLDLGCEL